jgi:hypothetical protein
MLLAGMHLFAYMPRMASSNDLPIPLPTIAPDVPPVLPDALSEMFTTYKDLLQTFASTAVPATFGNCSADDPPTPCSGEKDLYATSSQFYNVRARWLSGINTLNFEKMNFMTGINGSMTFEISVSFKSLPLSLRVDACLPVAGCANVLDNTETCCGGPKTINMTVVARCSENYPFIRNISVSQAQIQPSLEIKVPILGKSTTLFDASTMVTKLISTQGVSILEKGGLVQVQDKIKEVFGDRVFCTKDSLVTYLLEHPLTTPPNSDPDIPASHSTILIRSSSVSIVASIFVILF